MRGQVFFIFHPSTPSTSQPIGFQFRHGPRATASRRSPLPPPIRSPFCYRRLVSDSSRSPSRNPRRRVECDSKGKSILRESAQGRRRRRRVDADGGGKPYALCTAATMPLWYRWNGGSGRRTGTVLVSFLSFFFLWLSKASECATILTAEKTQSNQFKDQNKPFKPKKTQYNP